MWQIHFLWAPLSLSGLNQPDAFHEDPRNEHMYHSKPTWLSYHINVNPLIDIVDPLQVWSLSASNWNLQLVAKPASMIIDSISKMVGNGIRWTEEFFSHTRRERFPVHVLFSSANRVGTGFARWTSGLAKWQVLSGVACDVAREINNCRRKYLSFFAKSGIEIRQRPLKHSQFNLNVRSMRSLTSSRLTHHSSCKKCGCHYLCTLWW